jgi:hypothetical protein
MDDTAQTWTEYQIVSEGEGAIVYASTNDDNDDGVPDGEVAEWRQEWPTVEAALKHTGKTRTGFYGQPVRVFLDGQEVR